MTTQAQVIDRLEPELLKAIDKIRDEGSAHLTALWQDTRQALKDAISRHYRADFQREKWSVVGIAARGTIRKIDDETAAILQSFHRRSLTDASKVFRQIYSNSVLRHAWILDQVTPPSVTVHLPRSHGFMEAGGRTITTYSGPNADLAWKTRWSSWMDAYHSALIRNLQLGAINDSSVDDAMDEVDATRAGSPAYPIDSALLRIFENESQTVSAAGALDLVGANRGLGIKEVWQTRYNARVCDECDAEAGLTREEADDDIPAHPNCQCYWRLVPASWADLLKSGEAMDRELAIDLDAAGLVPGGMYVYGSGGKIVGSVVVNFPDWAAERMAPITGR